MRKFVSKILMPALAALLLLGLLGACKTKPKDDVVRLRFWHAWGGYEGKTIQALVDEFNATHPGIVVEASQITIGDKLLASIAGGKPPDIATVWSYMLTPMGEAGAFLPLNDFMTSSGYTQEDYLPHVWEYGMYSDQRWGVPTTLNVIAIYYIKEAARQVGLDPENPPRTTAELEEWSKRLLKRSPSGEVTRLGLVPNQFDSWFRIFGGRVFDESTRQFVIDSPENLAALNWMKHQVDIAGGMAAYRRFTAQFGKLDSPANPLLSGKLAIREDGQWVVKFFEEFAPEVEYGQFAFPPVEAGGQEIAKLDGSFWSIPVGSKHPEEAWTFVSWLIAPEQNARICGAFLNIPPMRATLEQPAFTKARENDKFEFFVRLLMDGKALPQPATPVSEQLYDRLESDTHRVYGGSLPAATMLKQLNNELNAELERANSLLGVDTP